jgi:hypothetical protein
MLTLVRAGDTAWRETSPGYRINISILCIACQACLVHDKVVAYMLWIVVFITYALEAGFMCFT